MLLIYTCYIYLSIWMDGWMDRLLVRYNQLEWSRMRRLMGFNKLTTNYNGDLRYEVGKITNIFIFMMWVLQKSGIPQTYHWLAWGGPMFQTTPYIWFLVVSRKLNTLLHQDLLLLNFPVTLIPFLLLPGGPSVGKPFLMIQVGGQKHQLWERTSPWILGRIKKNAKTGKWNQIFGMV